MNTLGMKFAPIPRIVDKTDDDFLMCGVPEGDHHADPRVLFSIWETRSRDYAFFVRKTGYDAGDDWKNAMSRKGPVGRGEEESADYSHHPVVNVSWNDANEFCLWLTERERALGRLGAHDVYRLPTSNEWCWSWSMENGESEYKRATTDPVGSQPPNDLGVYDHINCVLEWCGPIADPEGPKHFAVRRLSLFHVTQLDLQPTCRIHDDPGHKDDFLGFRCVLALG